MMSKTYTLEEQNFEQIELVRWRKHFSNDSQVLRFLLYLGFVKFCDQESEKGFDVNYDKSYKRYEIREKSKKATKNKART